MHILRAFLSGCVLSLIFVGFEMKPARAVNSDSPEVKAMIAKSLGYLATANHEQVGGKCLIALAFQKNHHELTHPKIAAAVSACYAARFGSFTECDNYNLGLMIVFLCETKEERHRPLVQRMLAELLKRQKANGAWGYEAVTSGDTSQTQYAVLAMWTAHQQGHEVPLASISGVTNWLLRTQDPSGGWGYQGIDPGKAGRVDQTPLTMSLTAAACGSLYILQDLVIIPGAAASGPGQPKSHAAMQEVTPPNQPNVRRRPLAGVDGAALTKAQADGKAWLQKNFKLEPADWEHYSFYAYERFASFLEKSENRREEAQWYNDMVRRLGATHYQEGYWHGQDTDSVATAFSVLVLSRSTQKTIEQIQEALGEGVLTGGFGLFADTRNLREINGKLVVVKYTGSVDQLIGLLSQEESPERDTIFEHAEPITLDADQTRRAGQIARLREIVSSGSPAARILAVRTLGKARDLDNVPSLLFALNDSDPNVVHAADTALRFTSRKFDGVLTFEVLDRATQQNLRKAWRDWFRSVKPDGELLD